MASERKAYLDAYRFKIVPVPSPPKWCSSDLSALIPPTIRVPLGRPRKGRRRATDEPRKDQNKTSKQGVQMTCGKYFKPRHNPRGYRNEINPRSRYFLTGFYVWCPC
ncbi:hypothetical protein Droror1_Dr00012244 [Drosera rotundifolia]